MQISTRGAVAVVATLGAALVVTGCGGSGGSGASSAAKDSPALDRIPQDAVGYATVDTDFSGENWQQFDKLAKAFDPDFPGVEEQFAKQWAGSSDGDEVEVDYEQDVKPWLGDAAGAALLSVEAGDEDGDRGRSGFVWVELQDREKFESFLKDQGMEQGKEVDGFATWSSSEDSTHHVAHDDEVAFLAVSRDQLESIVTHDGDSIADLDGVENAVDEVEGDSLVTLVLGGEGLRAAATRSSGGARLSDARQLEDFRGMALALSAEDEGMRLSGYVDSDGKRELENREHPVFEQLPANTVFAVGGSNLGGGLKDAAEDAGKEDADVQRGIGQATGLLGVDLDDLEDGLDGEFTLGLSADDRGLTALASGVAGATMGGGGLGGLDPAQLGRSVSILLAFEETGSTSKTLEKVVSSGAGLVGAGEARKGSAGDFETRESTLAGVPVTTASSDGVAALNVGADVFDAWGDETLGDHGPFEAAWKVADAPGKAAGVLWFDAARVAKLAGLKSGGDARLGGLVGWVEADGADGRIGMFLHVEQE